MAPNNPTTPVNTETIDLGTLVDELSQWVGEHGGYAATLEYVPSTVPEVRAANLVDVLSDYIHGRYIGDYPGSGQPTDSEGHTVVLL